MHILLTNDDGISSQNLAVLCAAAAARAHRVTVSAPSNQQSARSHAFTLSEPLSVRPASMPGAAKAWAVGGTPVDSCRLGIMNLAEGRPDLVISGINEGYNTGTAVYVSGTVGAAREAAFQGIPAIAASLEVGAPEETLRWFADWVVVLGEQLMVQGMLPRSVCSVNCPPLPLAQLKPPVLCPLNPQIYRDGYEERVNPRGGRYFWLGPELPQEEPVPGTDVALLREGHVTVTFLCPAMGAGVPIKDFEKILEKM